MTTRGVMLLVAGLVSGVAGAAEDGGLVGLVLDARTRRPLAQAWVVTGGVEHRTDDAGRFTLPPGATLPLSARAIGYRRHALATLPSAGKEATLALEPFTPKALYLSAFGIGNGELRGAALQLVEQTELNALVIDAKGDTSVVPWQSKALAAARIGRQTATTREDFAALLEALHQRGLYLIARVVVFKDHALVEAHPEWAVETLDGGTWLDGKGQAWVDPSVPETWELSLAVAEEAAGLGFDEVQFDYVRFPDNGALRFSRPSTEELRTATIDAFLAAARKRLARFNVFLSADVFGYVCWNTNDTHIGQRLDLLVERLDYLSPMLYPSGFAQGIPGYREPVAAPGPVVLATLKEGLRRSGLPGVRWRPWLQAFPDYAFDLRPFGAAEVRAQIAAAEALGTHGWLLWNPKNRYSAAGLTKAPAP